VILLLSTYDLGRQSFGLASPAAWLRGAGHEVEAVDLSRQKIDLALMARAAVVAVYLPMHTATRLAVPLIDRVRAVNPGAVVCAYGLYAPLNADLLRAHGVTHVLGPEFEADLLAVASGRFTAPPAERPSGGTPSPVEQRPTATIPRLALIQPDRRGLPALDRYASLQLPDGTRRVTGSTDATRGCKHRCRHCPIVPVYDGQFRVVPVEVVLADIRGQVERGAEHITFADPDFLNGPTHARRLVDAFRREWPSVTYDVTIKVEHLLRHRDLLPVLADTGCLFVTSAVESVDDRVLEQLEKGHTRAGFIEAAALCRAAGLTLSPTFVAFTPWTTLDGYADLLDVVAGLDLVGHVAPVQWGIRLLVTWQSRLLELPDIRAVIENFDSHTLTYPWRHADPRVDALQAQLLAMVGVQVNRPRHEIFQAIRAAVDAARGVAAPMPGPEQRALSRATIPYLNEPWYC
jgi:radical SAM superfamily enzyme YgiQ (UPF0313 family)